MFCWRVSTSLGRKGELLDYVLLESFDLTQAERRVARPRFAREFRPHTQRERRVARVSTSHSGKGLCIVSAERCTRKINTVSTPYKHRMLVYFREQCLVAIYYPLSIVPTSSNIIPLSLPTPLLCIFPSNRLTPKGTASPSALLPAQPL